MSNVAADNVAKLREMISGYMLSQIISATAVLGLADLLASGTVSGKALAEATGTHSAIPAAPAARPHPCGLRGGGRTRALSVSPRSAHCCGRTFRGRCATLRCLHGAEATWRAWGDLLHALRTGQTAFEHVFGMGSFQYSALDGERAAKFDAYMGPI